MPYINDMDETKYIRNVQTSVTCFLQYKDKYLFLKRAATKRVDPGKLNGVGGRLESGEDYLSAAIRETYEETGYQARPDEVKLCGVVKLEAKVQEDWVICFFKIRVDNKDFLKNQTSEDGEFLWLSKEEMLKGGYDLVDDLNYIFDKVVNDELFFFTAIVDANFKIEKYSVKTL
ncbi:MAG: hypothetical protein Fur003_5480 [Candidatus Dojkabacteria bacterium]